MFPTTLVVLTVIIVAIYLIRRKIKKNAQWKVPSETFPPQWRTILTSI